MVVAATQADPSTKILRFPYRSAMRPQSSRKQPKVRAYAETTHCWRESGMPISRPIVGRIMTTAWMDKVCSSVLTELTELASSRLRRGRDRCHRFLLGVPRLGTRSTHIEETSAGHGGNQRDGFAPR